MTSCCCYAGSFRTDAGQTRPHRGQTGGIVGRSVQATQEGGSTPVRGEKAAGGRIGPADGTADASPASGGQQANGKRQPMVKELTRPGTPLRRGAAPDTPWGSLAVGFVARPGSKACLLPQR